MAAAYEQPSGVLAPLSESVSDATGPEALDVLSDVLNAVRLTGALFFLVDAADPWVIPVPDSRVLAPAILPRSQHVVSYHVVMAGTCWGSLDGGEPVRLDAGDVWVVPHGDSYRMEIRPGTMDAPDVAEVMWGFREIVTALPFTLREGGNTGERLHLMCGFLGCDARPFNPLLETLPRVLHIRRGASPASDRLAHLIDFVLAESRARSAGGEAIRVRLSELMFVEVVRRYLAALPREQRDWLAGLRDPDIGHALAVLHADPASDWTLERLASAVGVSRSVLAERFVHFVGQPPMHYLALWRMQLAARLLADGDDTVASVAARVGYESEAAFSRAFKRASGSAPATWRHAGASGR